MGSKLSRWWNGKSFWTQAKPNGRCRTRLRRAHVSLELLEGRLVPTGSPYVVSNVNDLGPGSLREAILEANGDPSASVIQFNIPGVGVQDVEVSSALPVITG